MTANISSFYRGDTRVFRFVFTDADGLPVDITGHELWFTMKSNIDDVDEDAVLQKKLVFPAGVDATAGISSLTLESTDTDIEPGIYFYDFQRVIAGTPPNVTTLFSGKLRVVQDVTRSIS